MRVKIQQSALADNKNGSQTGIGSLNGRAPGRRLLSFLQNCIDDRLEAFTLQYFKIPACWNSGSRIVSGKI